jgi:hypothetical protein
LGEIQGGKVSFPKIADAPARLEWGAVQWYATSLVVAVATLTTVLAQSSQGVGASPWMVAALAGVAFLAERQSVHVTANLQTSVSALPILFAAVVFGPYAAMIVAGCALLTDFCRPRL